MSRHFWASALVAVGLCVGMPGGPGLAQDDELLQAIEAQHADWDIAFSTGDVDGLAGFFTPDAIWRGDDGFELSGQTSIGGLLRAIASIAVSLKVSGVAFSSEVEIVEALGADLVLDIGTYSAEWRNEAGEQSLDGRYAVLFKQLDGTWKIHRVFDFPGTPAAE